MQEEYPDLDFKSGEKYDEPPAYGGIDEFVPPRRAPIFDSTKLHKPTVLIGSGTTVGRSPNFEALPALVHFSGFKTGRVIEEEVSILNVSSHSQRLQILSPGTPEFSVAYEKAGSLAPGMRQKVTIKFKPEEYKYHYDCIRIRGEDQVLLIPIHAYPIPNKVFFPTQLDFGKIPICDTVKQVISLSCSIPVNFSFTIDIIDPHPQFSIDPAKGVIPANGDVKVRVQFSPITLGLCKTRIRLTVHQHQFAPVDCFITAQAVSGLIASEELQQSESRMLNHIVSTGSFLSGVIGKSGTLRGDIADALRKTREETGKMITATSYDVEDPVATLLANTFRVNKLGSALDRVVGDSRLIGTKVLSFDKSSGNFATGVRAVHGTLKATLPARPKGPGSGAAFDAGAPWITMLHGRQWKQSTKKGRTRGETGMFLPIPEEQVVSGLRIPTHVDSVTNVNFVITQEPGKLKPKDLKAAIDRNRAEREQRAEEQRRIREQGGGAGALDLRGILAEERMNVGEGDAFKRQLRELAFLADVEEVEKQETEREFRISEEFIGSNILAEDEIAVVLKQRATAALLKKRSQWRTDQSRQHSALLPPKSTTKKAGAPAAVLSHFAETLKPTFDPNRNDIWAKRMNSLRRVVAQVTKWVVQRRVTARLAKLKSQLQAAGVTNKEECRTWIDVENATSASRGGGGSILSKREGISVKRDSEGDNVVPSYPSVAYMVCSVEDEQVAKRKAATVIVESLKYEVDNDMVKRILFPQCIVEEGSLRLEVPVAPVEELTKFDDRTLFPLKIRPEYISMRYETHRPPIVPVYFPGSDGKQLRRGAAEEEALRPPADAGVAFADVYAIRPPEPAGLVALRAAAATAPPAPSDAADLAVTNGGNTGGQDDDQSLKKPDLIESKLSAPHWLTKSPKWDSDVLDYFKYRPQYRVYAPSSIAKETDPDWSLRPYAETLAYEDDSSLRSALLKVPGFLSANTYLLGGHENRRADPPPPPGPTLTDYYLPDTDRHRSGLFCMSKDHLRSLTSTDLDFTPLQMAQDNEDRLTDSESDDDEKYNDEKPSIAKVRKMLRSYKDAEKAAAPPINPKDKSPSKRGKSAGTRNESVSKAPGAIVSPRSANAAAELEAFGLGNGDLNKVVTQVELMRDRKILDLESDLVKKLQKNASDISERLANLSRKSKCLVQALPIQMPLHHYEDALCKLVENEMGTVPISYVENSAQRTLGSSSSPFDLLGSPSPSALSPSRI